MRRAGGTCGARRCRRRAGCWRGRRRCRGRPSVGRARRPSRCGSRTSGGRRIGRRSCRRSLRRARIRCVQSRTSSRLTSGRVVQVRLRFCLDCADDSDTPEPPPPPEKVLRRRSSIPSSFASALLAFSRMAVPTVGQPSRQSVSLLTAALQAGAASMSLAPAAPILAESVVPPSPPVLRRPSASAPNTRPSTPMSSPPRAVAPRLPGSVQLQTMGPRRLPTTRTVANDRHLHMLVAECVRSRFPRSDRSGWP